MLSRFVMIERTRFGDSSWRRHMHSRKIGITAALTVFAMICVGGCTTTYKSMKNWEGRTTEDLYWELGKPDEVEQIDTYNRVFTYISTRTNDDGEVKTCRKSFIARNYGHAEVITNTSYSGCLFLTFE